MLARFQKFMRGFYIDPALEAKAHRLADDAQTTLAKANATTFEEAQRALKKVEGVRDIIVPAAIGFGLLCFVAGAMAEAKKKLN